MTSSISDRNLLFGILALQLDFVTRDELIGAMHGWVLSKEVPLGDLLCQGGALTAEHRAVLESLVEAHVHRHDGDTQKSLAAISSVQAIGADLRALGDADLEQSLTRLPPASLDPFRTMARGAPSHDDGTARYQVLRHHAQGGLGRVSVARDEELDREVALKEIRELHADDLESRARFVREAKITGSLEHPGVVPVYGLGVYADGRPYYAMRFIHGDSLQRAIDVYHAQADTQSRSKRNVELRRLLGYVLDVCHAMEYAHSRGVVHRDLKPANIMLGRYGETLVVDWGLAKSSALPAGREDAVTVPPPIASDDSLATQMGAALGTPSYMSPEQAAGRLDLVGPASDVYSLGATLYCVLTGKPPFECGRETDLGEVLSRVKKGAFEPPRSRNRKLAKGLEAICLKAMALAPQQRYTGARQMAEDLERWLADEPVSCLRDSLSVRLARWTRRRRSLTQALAAALVLLTVGAVVAVGFVNRARVNEVRASRLAALTQECNVGIEPREWSAAHVARMNAVLAELERLDPRATIVLRQRLAASLERAINESLNFAKVSDEAVRVNRERIELLAAWNPTLADDVRRQLDDRLRQWDPVLDLKAPFTDKPLLLEPGVALTGDGCLELASSTIGDKPDAWIASRGGWPETVQWEVEFDDRWGQARSLGLSLRGTGEDRGYEFLVRIGAAAPTIDDDDRPEIFDAMPTLDDTRDKHGTLLLEIRKHGTLIQHATVSAADLPTGPLRLRAVFDRDEITWQVGSQPPLSVFDPFSLPHGEGRLGILWPAGVGVRNVSCRRQSAPNREAAAEEADQLFKNDQFDAALAKYQLRSIEGETRAARQESHYKAALCLESLRRMDEAAVELQMLFQENGDRFPLLAGCRLWLLEVRRQRWVEAHAVYSALTAKFPAAQIAAMFPLADREALVQSYMRQLGTVSSIYRLDPVPLDGLRRAVEIDRVVSPDGRGNPAIQNRLAVAMMQSGLNEEALEVVEPLTKQRLAIANYTRLLRWKGDAHAALAFVEELLRVRHREPSPDRNMCLLLLARCQHDLGNVAAAETNVDTVLNSDLATTVQLAQAYLIKGFLLSRRGDEQSARAVWQSGFNRCFAAVENSSGVSISIPIIVVMGSLSGTADDDQLIDLFMVVAGKESRFTTLLMGVIGKDNLATVVRTIWTTPRGRETAAATFAFESVDLAERARASAMRGAEAILRVNAFAGDLTPDQEATIARMLDLLYDRLFGDEVRRLSQFDLVRIGLAWEGQTNALGWSDIAPRLEAELRSSLGYVLAQRYLRKGIPGDAQLMLLDVLEHALPDSPTARAATVDQRLIEEKFGRLFAADVSDASAMVVVSHGAEVVGRLPMESESALNLPPGKYDLVVEPGDADLRVSPKSIEVVVGANYAVRVDGLWTSRHAAPAAAGLVHRSASLGGNSGWQVTTREPRSTITDVAWSPDGKFIAVSGAEPIVRLYDPATLKVAAVVPGHDAGVNAVSWSPDGQWLATAGRDATVRWWASTGTPGPVFRDTHSVLSVAWSKRGNWLASGNAVGVLRLWTKEGDSHRTISAHRGSLDTLDWDPKERFLATGGGDGEVHVWNVAGQRFKTLFNGSPVKHVAWSPDGEWLATSGSDFTVKFWKPDGTQGPVARLAAGSPPSLLWNADSRAVICGLANAKYEIINIDARSIASGTFPVSLAQMAWSPHGGLLVMGVFNGALAVCDREFKPVVSVPTQANIRDIAWNRQGSTLAVATQERRVRLISHNGIPLPTIETRSNSSIFGLAWDPAGKNLALGSGDGAVRIYNVDGSAGATLTGHQGFVRTVDWSSDGKWIASGGDDKTVRLWSTDGTTITSLDMFDNRVLHVRWSPDSKWLAVGRDSGSSGKPSLRLVTFDGKLGPVLVSGGIIGDVAWHPKLPRLSALAGNNFSQWDIEGKPIATSDKPLGSPAFAWSPDGNQFAVEQITSTRCYVSVYDYEKANFKIIPGSTRLRVSPAGLDWSSNNVLSVANLDRTITSWDKTSDTLLWNAVLIGPQDIAVFAPNGKVLYQTDKAADSLVYLVERPDRGFDVFTQQEFLDRYARWKE